ncbi:MAG: WXG100 family type VII secretion target [Sinomonas sp.]|nr:WXG100 family type VII secretion target [Sinomonas sp.]
MSVSAQKVATTMESVRAEVHALRAALEDLNGSWQGQAATNFQAVVAQWGGAEAQVYATLDLIGAALRNASVAYQEVELNNARLFQ